MNIELYDTNNELVHKFKQVGHAGPYQIIKWNNRYFVYKFPLELHEETCIGFYPYLEVNPNDFLEVK